jgi:type VI protein secretion system component Hcp
MAVFVKFDGVDGESQDKDHKDWANLSSLSQGQYVPASSVGAAAGRASEAFQFEFL